MTAANYNSRHSPDSLVACRGRNWVVMPFDQEELALLRPADGSEDDRIGIYTRIEPNAISPSNQPVDVSQACPRTRRRILSGASLLRNAFRLNHQGGRGPHSAPSAE